MVRRFIILEDGVVAIITGLMLGIITAAVTMTIDYSNATKVKSQVQRISDASALIAARTYRDTDDKKIATESANQYFNNAMISIPKTEFKSRVEVRKVSGSKDIIAVNEADLEIGSYIAGFGMPSLMKASLVSETQLRELPQDLYLILLVDSSGSMQSLIDSVKLAVMDLEQSVRDALLAKGVDIGRVYVKAAFFGDLRFDVAPTGWSESPVYNLAVPDDTLAFRDFVAGQITHFGYDTPESTPAGIAHFLTAPLPPELDVSQTVQAIVAWTDAPGLPLDHATYTHDTTVNLYKAYGELGTEGNYIVAPEYMDFQQIDVAHYDEASLFDGDAEGGEPSPPAYGCCSSMDVFEDRWRTGGTIALDRRMLGLIVPTLEQPWAEMATWPNVTVRDYTAPTVSGILDNIVDSLSTRYSPLVVSQ